MTTQLTTELTTTLIANDTSADAAPHNHVSSPIGRAGTRSTELLMAALELRRTRITENACAASPRRERAALDRLLSDLDLRRDTDLNPDHNTERGSPRPCVRRASTPTVIPTVLAQDPTPPRALVSTVTHGEAPGVWQR